MPTCRYLHYDVFTDRALEGNQLAVFPEPGGLTDALMQSITREMNFSECTFIFPAERPDTDVRMRIFTPGEELPMAGHPTIGSTFALAAEGVIAGGRDTFVFGLNVGPTPVSLTWKDGALDFAWMTQKNPQYGPSIQDRAALATAIGVAERDLMDAPVQEISCGVPFLFAALASREAVDRVTLNAAAYADVCRTSGLQNRPFFFFTPQGEGVYSRMLAPGFGIAEDPATGGASGPLGCYILKYGLLPRERLAHFVSLQGVKMLRPSTIHVSIDHRGDEVARVRVGGRSVLVGEGTLRF